MATRTTTQAGNISNAATFGGTAFVNGDNVVAAHALTIDTAVICGNSPIGAPTTAPSLAKTTGGSLAVLTYNIRYTQVDAAGNESDFNPNANVNLLTDATNNKLVVTLPALPSGVVSYNIYGLTGGTTWFRQVTGATAGANNITTFSSATAYAPVYALKVANPNGRLIVNANLTLKGSLGLEGTTTATDVIVTQAAGTVVEFDGTASANTTFGYQTFMGGFINGRKSIYWVTNGTSGSRCAIRSKSGAGNMQMIAFNSETGVVNFNFTDITRVGDATFDALSIAGGNSTAVTINFANCVFDTCGRWVDTTSFNVATNFTVQNNTWKNTLHATECFRMGGSVAAPTGTRTWIGNVADKQVIFSLLNLVIGGTNAADTNIFMEMPVGSGTGVRCQSVRNTFFRYTGVSGAYRMGDWLDVVMFVDGSTLSPGTGTYSVKADLSNPHWCSPSPGPDGTYQVVNTIFESMGADDQGDVDYGPNGASLNSQFTGCIGVPEDIDASTNKRSVGTLTTLNGWSGTLNRYNHNTWFLGGQGAIALAEGGNGFVNMCDELQSNIFWNVNRGAEGATTYNRITYEPTRIASLSGTSMLANPVNKTKTGYNCRFNLYTGSGTDALLGAYTDGGYLGKSYHHYAIPATGWGDTDFNVDPQFVDATARFWTWVKSLAGLTLPGNATPDRKDYQAYGLYKLTLKNEPNHVDYDARYTVAAYRAYIRNAFTPTNTALIGTAHDGTTVGAVQPTVTSPAVGDVRLGVHFGVLSASVGTLKLPTAAQVRTGVGFGAASTEFTGTLTLPTANQVLTSISYGAGGVEFTGTITLPTAAQVLTAISYGAGGTQFTGTITLPSVTLVLAPTTFGAGGALTGTLTLPTAAQVKNGVVYGIGGTGLTGTVTLPTAAQVLSGISYGAAATEFTGTVTLPSATLVLAPTTYGAGGTAVTGTLAVPVVGDVRSGVSYAVGLTGNLTLPGQGSVLSGVTYGTLGTEFTGTFALPATGDVQSGVTYGVAGSLTGGLVMPSVNDVRDGVGYGTLGTEFVGNVLLPSVGTVLTGVAYGSLGAEFTGTLMVGGGGGATLTGNDFYSRLARTAKRLIEGKGRTVTLRKYPTTLANSDQPWRGTTGSPTDCLCKAVLLGDEENEDTSDNLRRGTKHAYVAALSAVDGSLVEYDLRDFETMIDGTETWEIKNVDPLIPADIPLLYKLELRR